MKLITSRDNPIFRHLVKLKGSARQRRTAGQTLLDGAHLVSDYNLVLGPAESLVVSEAGSAIAEIKQLLAEHARRGGGDVAMLSDALFREISPVTTPSGVMALIPIPPPETIPFHQSKSGFCVLLEAMQDPGNVGSILRSAAAAGASKIYMSDGCADAWAPKTLRAAMGAHFLLRIYERSDLVEVARTFKGRVVASTLKAKNSLYQLRLTGPTAFVFGSEGTGLSEAMLQASTEQVTIPMPGGMESLNAAAAAAVCFFEKVRQIKTEACNS
ncbi:TrmH family RNA methyltransferase [Nitrosospira briensis]|uniref:TrmH family RNA methyltransferase n=1 Tax=Nitrosospira briensis TaxID=35799 RepID=UPI0008ED37E4|nr:RNA methyltransferase [Nitrosospira briensis]SFO20880.1 RNA methyltransferase, TrmH family [Nitrosospira briensis]